MGLISNRAIHGQARALSCALQSFAPIKAGRRYQITGVALATDARDGRLLAMGTFVGIELDRVSERVWVCTTPGVGIRAPYHGHAHNNPTLASLGNCARNADDLALWFDPQEDLYLGWGDEGHLALFINLRESAPASVMAEFCGAIVDLGPTPAAETEARTAGG